MWHQAVGGALSRIPDDSWDTVLEEKHADMLHLLQFPYNGEPPERLVTEKEITPNSLHFVRNHGGIPIIEKEHYSFLLDGLVKNLRSFTLNDVMDESKFPRMEKVITMQCSGTRRIEQILKYPGHGDEVPQTPWAEGAIGTAKYVGISLKKVIKACGGLIEGAKDLEFYGADTYFKDDKTMNYLVSVPWSKVNVNEAGLGNEWRNPPPNPRISPPHCRVRLYRRPECQMALSHQSHQESYSRASANTGVPLFPPAGRQAQLQSHRWHSDPRDATQFRHHVAVDKAGCYPRR